MLVGAPHGGRSQREAEIKIVATYFRITLVLSNTMAVVQHERAGLQRTVFYRLLSTKV